VYGYSDFDPQSADNALDSGWMFLNPEEPASAGYRPAMRGYLVMNDLTGTRAWIETDGGDTRAKVLAHNNFTARGEKSDTARMTIVTRQDIDLGDAYNDLNQGYGV
jgi:hypothetical protein